MNKNKKNTKNGLGQLLERLVAADANHFDECLNAIVNEMMKCRAMFEEGEADECFDPILEGWHPTDNLAEDMAWRVYCVAAVLHAIATRFKNAETIGKNSHPYGWPALSQNAKRWCRTVIVMGSPDILPPSAREYLRRANNRFAIS